ncbi:MAG: DUF4197 domain-containing protein [Flavitalea sp.]
MIRTVILTLGLGASSLSSCDTLSNLPGTIGYPNSTTQDEASTGIRQALSNGIASAISNLGRENGFFGDQFYKVLLPQDAVKIESTLRSIGMGSQVDKAILQINRAAEDAVQEAKPIFVNAITSMTITDAMNIIRGGNTAATDYFRGKTREQLIQAFKPSIEASLQKTQATKYYADLVNAYNRLPTTFKKLNPDLTSHVVGKTTDALFDQIQKEEVNIRQNPAARTTEILRKVFG